MAANSERSPPTAEELRRSLSPVRRNRRCAEDGGFVKCGKTRVFWFKVQEKVLIKLILLGKVNINLNCDTL